MVLIPITVRSNSMKERKKVPLRGENEDDEDEWVDKPIHGVTGVWLIEGWNQNL